MNCPRCGFTARPLCNDGKNYKWVCNKCGTVFSK